MLDFLIAPVKRIAAPNTPAPFSPPMEKFYVPDAKRIAREVSELIAIS
jgi:pyruvate/2-oxoglutarate/acetoin dehydrogenase E1 component